MSLSRDHLQGTASFVQVPCLWDPPSHLLRQISDTLLYSFRKEIMPWPFQLSIRVLQITTVPPTFARYVLLSYSYYLSVPRTLVHLLHISIDLPQIPSLFHLWENPQTHLCTLETLTHFVYKKYLSPFLTLCSHL